MRRGCVLALCLGGFAHFAPTPEPGLPPLLDEVPPAEFWCRKVLHRTAMCRRASHTTGAGLTGCVLLAEDHHLPTACPWVPVYSDFGGSRQWRDPTNCTAPEVKPDSHSPDAEAWQQTPPAARAVNRHTQTILTAPFEVEGLALAGDSSYAAVAGGQALRKLLCLCTQLTCYQMVYLYSLVPNASLVAVFGTSADPAVPSGPVKVSVSHSAEIVMFPSADAPQIEVFAQQDFPSSAPTFAQLPPILATTNSAITLALSPIAVSPIMDHTALLTSSLRAVVVGDGTDSVHIAVYNVSHGLFPSLDLVFSIAIVGDPGSGLGQSVAVLHSGLVAAAAAGFVHVWSLETLAELALTDPSVAAVAVPSLQVPVPGLATSLALGQDPSGIWILSGTATSVSTTVLNSQNCSASPPDILVSSAAVGWHADCLAITGRLILQPSASLSQPPLTAALAQTADPAVVAAPSLPGGGAVFVWSKDPLAPTLSPGPGFVQTEVLPDSLVEPCGPFGGLVSVSYDGSGVAVAGNTTILVSHAVPEADVTDAALGLCWPLDAGTPSTCTVQLVTVDKSTGALLHLRPGDPNLFELSCLRDGGGEPVCPLPCHKPRWTGLGKFEWDWTPLSAGRLGELCLLYDGVPVLFTESSSPAQVPRPDELWQELQLQALEKQWARSRIESAQTTNWYVDRAFECVQYNPLEVQGSVWVQLAQPNQCACDPTCSNGTALDADFQDPRLPLYEPIFPYPNVHYPLYSPNTATHLKECTDCPAPFSVYGQSAPSAFPASSGMESPPSFVNRLHFVISRQSRFSGLLPNLLINPGAEQVDVSHIFGGCTTCSGSLSCPSPLVGPACTSVLSQTVVLDAYRDDIDASSVVFDLSGHLWTAGGDYGVMAIEAYDHAWSLIYSNSSSTLTSPGMWATQSLTVTLPPGACTAVLQMSALDADNTSAAEVYWDNLGLHPRYSGAIPWAERSALQDLYSACNGASWIDSGNWM
eukprot:gene12447-2269_t